MDWSNDQKYNDFTTAMYKHGCSFRGLSDRRTNQLRFQCFFCDIFPSVFVLVIINTYPDSWSSSWKYVWTRFHQFYQSICESYLYTLSIFTSLSLKSANLLAQNRRNPRIGDIPIPVLRLRLGSRHLPKNTTRCHPFCWNCWNSGKCEFQIFVNLSYKQGCSQDGGALPARHPRLPPPQQN